MRSVTAFLLSAATLGVGCDTSVRSSERAAADQPSSETRTNGADRAGQSDPASDHESLQIDVETAIREIDIDLERCDLEGESANSAVAEGLLEDIEGLQRSIEKVRKRIHEAARNESTEFRKFRRKYEKELADREARARALEQTLQRKAVDNPT